MYMPKASTSKEMVETRNYSKFFMVKFPEILGNFLYNISIVFCDSGVCSNIVMDLSAGCIFAGPFED